MAKILPVTGAPSYVFSVPLEGNIYTFQIRWNDRTASWYFAIYNSDLIEIVNFEKISPKQALITDNLDLFPDGNIFVFPTIDENLEPIDRNNFGVGKKYEMVFVTVDEIVSLLG